MKTIEPPKPARPTIIKNCETCGKVCKYSCPQCDRDWCAECIHRGKDVVGYWNSVAGGWVLVAYCTPCDIAVSEAGGDDLYKALTAVRVLRDKYKTLAAEAKIADVDLKAIAILRGLIA